MTPEEYYNKDKRLTITAGGLAFILLAINIIVYYLTK